MTGPSTATAENAQPSGRGLRHAHALADHLAEPAGASAARHPATLIVQEERRPRQVAPFQVAFAHSTEDEEVRWGKFIELLLSEAETAQ